MRIPDLFPVIAGFSLAPILVLAPGYYWSRLIHPGGLSRPERAAWSLLLSLATTPILAYNFFLLVPYRPVTIWMFALLQLGLPAMLSRLFRSDQVESPPFPSGLRWLWVFPALLAILAPACVMDVEWGDRLYRGQPALDYVKHIVVTDTVTRTGIHPINPAFYPGRPLPLFYYFFWFLLCSLVDGLSFQMLGARVAVEAMTAWGALALFAAVFLLASRFLRPLSRRTLAFCFVLVFASGLDIIPTIFLAFFRIDPGDIVPRDRLFILPDVDSWNGAGQVPSWLSNAIWTPHHLAAAVTGMTGLLLVFGLPDPRGRASAWIRGLLFAAASASGLGLSIWVTLVMGVFWLLWGIVAVARRWRGDLRLIIPAAVAAVLLAMPFIVALSHARLDNRAPLAFDVRNFGLWHQYTFFRSLGIWRELIDLAWLVPGYLLELGVFFFGGLCWVKHRRKPLERPQLALALLTAVSLTMVSLLRSSLHNNDFGTRGVMPAQFVLLLWTAWTLERLWRLRSRRPFALACWVSLAAGISIVPFDWALMRSYPAAQDLMAQQGAQGRRHWTLKRCYEKIRRVTPREAVVQANPDVLIELDHGFNAYRQSAFLDRLNGIVFDTQGPAFDPVRQEIAALFAPSASSESILQTARKYGIHVVVVKETDPVWESPAWEDHSRFRAFVECPGVRAYEVIRDAN